MQNIRAEILLPAQDVREDIAFFTKTLGFRLDEIYPADDPRVIVLSGFGLRLRLDADLDAVPGTIRLLCDDPQLIAGGKTSLTAPSGNRIEIVPLAPPVEMPPTAHEFVVRRLADQAPWVIGRAGMHYRDLVPSRLGGAIIASHIRIPDGGPVPDMVHFHSVGFQLIFCIKGWVDLVYEDQGPPFRLHAGNCVIQPPEIRHRVLYASDNIEVVEIGVPAEHVTTIDHAMELPTEIVQPEREFSGQTFVHHRAEDAKWVPHRLGGYEARDTGVARHTKGVAHVAVLRPDGGQHALSVHDADIYFGFVMAGEVTLEGDGKAQPLTAGDAFVIPPGLPMGLRAPSADFELLEVALPGTFGIQDRSQTADPALASGR
ncbi:MAG: cupin domain-containing protein [Pseudomonadota bacterium]